MRIVLFALVLMSCGNESEDKGKPDATPDSGSPPVETIDSTPPEEEEEETTPPDPPIAGALTLCREPVITATETSTWTVSDAEPGERIQFFFGRGMSKDETCFESLGDLCTLLLDPVEIGEAYADTDGIAELLVTLKKEEVGTPVAIHAFAARGLGGVSSVSSDAVEGVIETTGDLAETCIAPDICEDLPDADGDGTPDACDACSEGADDVDEDGDGVPDACDYLNVDPLVLHLEADAEEETTGRVTLTSRLGVDTRFELTSPCRWLTADTGNPVPTTGVVPAGGVAQFNVLASAIGAVPDTYSCDLAISTDHPDYPTMGPVDVQLEVTEPGLDYWWPPVDATTPSGLSNVLLVRVTDESGVGQSGYLVDFRIDTPGTPVLFTESGTAEHRVTTDGNGDAIGTLVPPDDWEGEVEVELRIWDLAGTVVEDTAWIMRRWIRPQGNIYFWELDGGGGNIMVMPADFETDPTVFDGTALDGHCSGCHTASPTALPTTGNPAVFVQDRSVSPLEEQIIDTVTGELVAVFEGDSADNDWSPDSRYLAWTNRDVMVFDVVTGTNTAVPGADNPDYGELYPTFSSDGSHIAYTKCEGCGGDLTLSATAGTMSIWSIPSVGGEPVELVPSEPDTAIYYPEFSPDGRWLAYNKSWTNQSGGTPASTYSASTAELWIVPVDPTGGFTTGPARRLDIANGDPGTANSWPTWAPDSTFVAFASDRTGDWDVFLSAISNTGEDSPAVSLPGASGPGGQHIPAWAP